MAMVYRIEWDCLGEWLIDSEHYSKPDAIERMEWLQGASPRIDYRVRHNGQTIATRHSDDFALDLLDEDDDLDILANVPPNVDREMTRRYEASKAARGLMPSSETDDLTCLFCGADVPACDDTCWFCDHRRDSGDHLYCEECGCEVCVDSPVKACPKCQAPFPGFETDEATARILGCTPKADSLDLAIEASFALWP